MVRDFLRVVAAVAGVCLFWPGTWALITMPDLNRYPGEAPIPLSDRIVDWSMAAAIWTASFFLIRFAARKPK
jgi:hypothetical protein